MRLLLSIFILLYLSVTPAQATAVCNNDPMHIHRVTADTTHPGLQNKKSTPAAQWDAYWKAFTTAINTKDTARIAELTSADFYDGGGATVQEWLQSEVYGSDKTFATFTSLLKKGTRPFKSYGNTPYRATGNNKSGDYFFEYSHGRWIFGGMVGD